GAASGTPYFSCEDVDMTDFNMEKTNLGLLPDFANTLVSVTGQTKSRPEALIQICGSGIGNNGQETVDSRLIKRSQESASSQEVPMEEGEEKDKEDGELEEETEESETLGSDIKIPRIYRLIARYFPKSVRCNVLYMLENHVEGDQKTYYSWAVDRSYHLSLILQFELEYRKQEGKWPAEPYDRMWPGHYEVLEDYWPFKDIREAPGFTPTMLTEENAMIWPLYATPYSAYLVELFCTFLSYAPKCAPKDLYVPDEKFTEAWDDSQQLLQDYMEAHFQHRPEPIDESMMIEYCVTLIEKMANQ
ncbi:MAG: hypothetical protein GY861_02520, partial [bacterium]|nr:hypothetical protein [bacterium]